MQTQQLDLFSKAKPSKSVDNPFQDRTVLITGNFKQEKKFLKQTLKDMGADIEKKNNVTKNINFVLIGEAPTPNRMKELDKLIFNGYHIRVLHQADIDKILAGEWDGYFVEKENKKNLSLTYEHYERKHIVEEYKECWFEYHILYDGYTNMITGKEMFYGKDFKGDFALFGQLTGNLGAFGDNLQIYPETEIVVLSDRTVERLKKGEKDETIKYIEDFYNNSKIVFFDYHFISESNILNFCKRRCEKCGDEITMSLYNKYVSSMPEGEKVVPDSPYLFNLKYRFNYGENFCHVDDNIVFKLSDGRTWFPSRQIR